MGSGSACLISIRPPFLQAILDGTKRVEFRTRTPAFKPGQMLLLYETSPRCAVRGVAWVRGVVTKSPASLWREFRSVSGISRGQLLGYLQGRSSGCAVVLSSVMRLQAELPLAELRGLIPGFHPPQFYRRMTQEELGAVGLNWLLAATPRVRRGSVERVA